MNALGTRTVDTQIELLFIHAHIEMENSELGESLITFLLVTESVYAALLIELLIIVKVMQK
jgi:hypothetical protein